MVMVVLPPPSDSEVSRVAIYEPGGRHSGERRRCDVAFNESQRAPSQ